jgi:hypothetical protein
LQSLTPNPKKEKQKVQGTDFRSIQNYVLSNLDSGEDLEDDFSGELSSM